MLQKLQYEHYRHLQKTNLTLSHYQMIQMCCNWPLLFQWTESSLGGISARRNQVSNAEIKCGQSSTLRVQKLRHWCNNSCASDIGRVEIILKNDSSSSWITDLWPIGETISLQTFNTGSQSLTSFILTWNSNARIKVPASCLGFCTIL